MWSPGLGNQHRALEFNDHELARSTKIGIIRANEGMVISRELMNRTSLKILLVEDNPAHAELVLRSFEEHRFRNEIIHLSDGEAALDYLSPNVADSPNPLPYIILLDLRLPRVDGLEVLRQIKNSDRLRKIPVVVLTTSGAERDVAEAYALHANSYIVKPIDFARFAELMDDLGRYWLGMNYYPWA